MFVSRGALVHGAVNSSVGVVDQDDVSQRRYKLGLESRAGQMRDEMGQERDVGSWVFARQVRLGADDEVGGLEVVEGGENLRCIEGRVQRYEDGAQLEERVRRLWRVSITCVVDLCCWL